jgi:hypothetical protein
MEVTCNAKKRDIDKIVSYACYFTLKIVDNGTNLIVRRSGSAPIVFYKENEDLITQLTEFTRSYISVFQNAVHENTISNMGYIDAPFAKRMKKVFYAVIDEFLDENFTVIIKV